MPLLRINLAEKTDEAWTPPRLITPNTPWRRCLAAVRRWFDLQAGSIWSDLRPHLQHVQGVVLDVGCGAQPYRSVLPPDAQYRGIDTIDAKDHFGYEVADTLYYAGDAWPVDEASVDLVLATETLEHVFHVEPFLAQAARCLRPGGTFLASVPFSARWHFILHDFWRFIPACLKRLLEQAGFCQVTVHARGNALTVACYKVMAVVLLLLMPQHGGPWRRSALRLLEMLAAPLFLLCAVLGNLSLRSARGDDCLGYTVHALKPNAACAARPKLAA